MNIIELKTFNRIKTWVIAKKLCDTFIFLSCAVILSSVLVFYFSKTIINPILGHIDLDIVRPREFYYGWLYYFNKQFLSPFILPGVIMLLSITPVRIIIGIQLKHLIARQVDCFPVQNKNQLQTRIRQNFLFRNYRDSYFKTYAPKKFQASNLKNYK
ncbi:MAG: hypothetical protein ACXADU_09785 [Promethearchaeota archaeon]|jgi:hypothetical protein